MLSQVLSVLLGGHPDKSLSQRTAEAHLAHSGRNTVKSRWFKFQMNLIDLLFWNIFWKIEESHCIKSLDGESIAREIWVWSKR